jgi:hypothetical protein
MPVTPANAGPRRRPSPRRPNRPTAASATADTSKKPSCRAVPVFACLWRGTASRPRGTVFRTQMRHNRKQVPPHRNHIPPTRNHIPQNQSLNQSGIKSLPPCPPRGTGRSKFLPGCLPVSGKPTATIAAGSSPPPRNAWSSASSITGNRRATTPRKSSAFRS